MSLSGSSGRAFFTFPIIDIDNDYCYHFSIRTIMILILIREGEEAMFFEIQLCRRELER